MAQESVFGLHTGEFKHWISETEANSLKGFFSLTPNDELMDANYKETQTANIQEGLQVKVKVDAVPGVAYKGVVTAIANATGAQYSVVPVDNATGNFVKIKQRIPVRIDFTTENTPEDLKRLRSGMNVECEVIY